MWILSPFLENSEVNNLIGIDGYVFADCVFSNLSSIVCYSDHPLTTKTAFLLHSVSPLLEWGKCYNNHI